MSELSKPRSLRDLRLERKRRKKLACHKYSDIALKEILDEMWKRQDAYGSLKRYPRVVNKYINNEPSMTVNDKAHVLRNRVENNLIWRLNTQPGSRDFYTEESTTGRRQRIMVFSWFGTKPTLPPILESHPTIAFEQLFSDPRICKLEKGHTTVIESGEELFRNCSAIDSLQVPFGTLGAILTIEKEGQFTHAGLTVGHVIGDDDESADSAKMGPPGGNEQLTLSTWPECERFLGRPSFRRKWPNPRKALDEICLLQIPAFPPTILSVLDLKCLRTNLDCRQISAICPVVEQETTHPGVPLLKDISPFRQWIRQQGGLEVFKDGAKTGLTSGKLINLREIMDWKGQLSTAALRSSSSDPEPLSGAVEQDQTPIWVLEIKWVSPSQPFAEDGDSGSIVYAKANGCIIPLGIHSGSNGDVSTAYSLHSWWEEFEFIDGNADIYFCDPSRCRQSEPILSPELQCEIQSCFTS